MEEAPEYLLPSFTALSWRILLPARETRQLTAECTLPFWIVVNKLLYVPVTNVPLPIEYVYCTLFTYSAGRAARALICRLMFHASTLSVALVVHVRKVSVGTAAV